MEDFRKQKKIYKITTILIAILAVICFIAAISLDFVAEIDDTVSTIFFVVSLSLVVLTVSLIFIIYKFYSRATNRIVEQLNHCIDKEYKYQQNVPILDIVVDSLYPTQKNEQFFALESILGKYEDIPFEYYLFASQKKQFLITKDEMVELYVFKNSCVFPKRFFVSAQEIKSCNDYKKISTTGNSYIYMIQNDDVIIDDLPQNVLFLSVNQQTLFVYMRAESKKALWKQAEDVDHFKELFDLKIENIKKIYEETKAWAK